eukprot:12109757-Alexandrium_andersonii.AAC.1
MQPGARKHETRSSKDAQLATGILAQPLDSEVGLNVGLSDQEGRGSPRGSRSWGRRARRNGSSAGSGRRR